MADGMIFLSSRVGSIADGRSGLWKRRFQLERWLSVGAEYWVVAVESPRHHPE